MVCLSGCDAISCCVCKVVALRSLYYNAVADGTETTLAQRNDGWSVGTDLLFNVPVAPLGRQAGSTMKCGLGLVRTSDWGFLLFH